MEAEVYVLPKGLDDAVQSVLLDSERGAVSSVGVASEATTVKELAERVTQHYAGDGPLTAVVFVKVR